MVLAIILYSRVQKHCNIYEERYVEHRARETPQEKRERLSKEERGQVENVSAAIMPVMSINKLYLMDNKKKEHRPTVLHHSVVKLTVSHSCWYSRVHRVLQTQQWCEQTPGG